MKTTRIFPIGFVFVHLGVTSMTSDRHVKVEGTCAIEPAPFNFPETERSFVWNRSLLPQTFLVQF